MQSGILGHDKEMAGREVEWSIVRRGNYVGADERCPHGLTRLTKLIARRAGEFRSYRYQVIIRLGGIKTALHDRHAGQRS